MHTRAPGFPMMQGIPSPPPPTQILLPPPPPQKVPPTVSPTTKHCFPSPVNIVSPHQTFDHHPLPPPASRKNCLHLSYYEIWVSLEHVFLKFFTVAASSIILR